MLHGRWKSNPARTRIPPRFPIESTYSGLSVNGNLYKTDTLVKQKPIVGPSLSLTLHKTDVSLSIGNSMICSDI